MRPLQLVMSAFGPFAGEVRIDFERLGTHGIYLICGDTGAGKTTIFDAISFALFGMPSGADRTTRSLRSDFAAPEAKTYVELEFEHRGRSYRIRRNPAYQRPKRRGEGMTQELADATFEELDGGLEKPPITRVAAVDAHVRELLGIDRAQFSQIVMIAQGDFRRLLSADTKERSAILRKLFGTAPYKDFEFALESRRKKLAEESRVLDGKLGAYAAMIQVDEGRQEALGRLQALEAPDAQALLSLADGQDGRDAALEARLEEELDATSKKESELGTLLARARQREDLAARREEAGRLWEEARAKVPRLQADLEASEALLGEMDSLASQAAVIGRELPLYAELEKVRKDARDARARRDAAKKAFDAARDARMRAEDALARARAREAELSGAPAELERARAGLDQAGRVREEARAGVQGVRELERRRGRVGALEARATKARQALEAATRGQQEQKAALAGLEASAQGHAQATERLAQAELVVERLERRQREALAARQEVVQKQERAKKEQDAREGAEAAYLEARAAHTAAHEQYSLIEQAFLDAQAGILAKALVPGGACPVCGSTEHPHPAGLSGTAPTEDEVKEARAKSSAEHEKFVHASETASAARTRAQAAASELEGLTGRVGTPEEIDGRLARLSSQLEEARTGRDAAQAEKDLLESLQKEIGAARLGLEKASQGLDEARASASRASQELEGERSRLEEFSSGLAVRDAAVANQALLDAQARYDVAAEELSRKEGRAEDLARTRERVRELTRQVTDLREGGGTSREDLDGARDKLSTLQAQEEALAARLSFAGEQEARQQIEKLRARHGQMEAGLARARKALEGARRDEAARKAECLSIDAQLSALAGEDGTTSGELAASLEKVRARHGELNTQWAAVRSRRRNNAGVSEQLEKLAARIARVGAAYDEVAPLALTATGRLTGRERLSFETYLQVRWFDRVIAAANRRFSPMSGGRYELVRHTGPQVGGGQSGLDLDVLDTFTGKPRAASSLSGGESFQASLSLALGLSDVVQASSGGIELDAMFVDEGFGTLDEEALGLAVTTLSGLSGSGKLVAIISHVEELRESMEHRIVVERGRGGSTVRMELD